MHVMQELHWLGRDWFSMLATPIPIRTPSPLEVRTRHCYATVPGEQFGSLGAAAHSSKIRFFKR
jgi:hypothetical protein